MKGLTRRYFLDRDPCHLCTRIVGARWKEESWAHAKGYTTA